MTKRKLLTSVAASTVLAGVLMLSGCGGSSKVAENVNFVEIADGNATIQIGDGGLTANVEIPVVGKDQNGIAVETSEIKIDKSAAQLTTECTTASPCTVVATQNSMCSSTPSQADLDEANTLRPLVPGSAGKMVVYSGSLNITETNGKLTGCPMTVTIKLPTCSLMPAEIDGRRKMGLGDCDTMKIYVTDVNGGTGYWVTAYIDSNTGCSVAHKDQYVTFTITGVPKHIVIFGLTAPRTTGVTGGTGGEGYQ
jgi:hypothetical protein